MIIQILNKDSTSMNRPMKCVFDRPISMPPSTQTFIPSNNSNFLKHPDFKRRQQLQNTWIPEDISSGNPYYLKWNTAPIIFGTKGDGRSVSSTWSDFVFTNWNAAANSYGVISTVRKKNATRETTVALKAWLYEHQKNPYPTKGEKIMLALISKMSLTQVSTWFANARRRLKKESRLRKYDQSGTEETHNDESCDLFDATNSDQYLANEARVSRSQNVNDFSDMYKIFSMGNSSEKLVDLEKINTDKKRKFSITSNDEQEESDCKKKKIWSIDDVLRD